MAEANVMARADGKGGGLIGDLGVGLNANAGVLNDVGSRTVLKDATIGDNNTVNVDDRKITNVNVEAGGTYVEKETLEEKWEGAKKIASDVEAAYKERFTLGGVVKKGLKDAESALDSLTDTVTSGCEKTAAQLKAKFSRNDSELPVVETGKSADDLSL